MAGRSDEHNALAFRLAAVFAARMPSGRRGYSPDQRFWIASTARGRYSDGSIIGGKPDHPPHDEQAQSLASLQAYVLVAQDARRVHVYRRATMACGL